LTIFLCKNGAAKSRLIHQLVARAFIGLRLCNYIVRHGPKGKTVNSVDNLSYGTWQDDREDMYRDGTFTRAKPVIRSDGKIYRSASQVANEIGVSRCMISQVCYDNQRNHKVGGFNWEYINV